MEAQIVDIKRVKADPNQPRKYFDASKMHLITESLRREGIITPLIVEAQKNGDLMLVDGERRLRAATELGFKEVPVVIEEERSEKDRLLRQFNIQEQHDSWTPIEKAQAIVNMSKQFGISVRDTCLAAGVSDSNAGRYSAFAVLLSKDLFLKENVGLDFAQPIRGIVNIAKRIKIDTLEQPFTEQDERTIETKLIRLVAQGIVLRKNDVVHLKDAFMKDPNAVNRFIAEENTTPESLFIDTKAKGAHHLRNGLMSVRYVITNLEKYNAIRDVEVTPETLATLKHGRDVIQATIDGAE